VTRACIRQGQLLSSLIVILGIVISPVSLAADALAMLDDE
jgi:hypothetical protein